MNLFGKDKNIQGALTRVMQWARFGNQGGMASFLPPELVGNGEYLCAPDSANSELIPFASVDSAKVAYIPIPKLATYNVALNAALGTTRFFIADTYYKISAIRYSHKTQGTGTIGVGVTKDTNGQAAGGGVNLLATTFDAVAIVNNTVTTGTLTSTTANLYLNPGDSLSVTFPGTVSTLAGVVVEVTLIAVNSGISLRAVATLASQNPSTPSNTAAYFVRRQADLSTTPFFLANTDMVITGVYAMYSTAFATGVTIDITKDSSTNAPGAGVSILSAAMKGDGTANALLTPALTATTTRLTMAAGDRLSVKYSATTTGTGVCIVVVFAPLYNRIEQSFFLGPNAQQQVAQNFFIFNRKYEVIDASFVGGTAAGGVATLGVTIDKGTTAPGGGNAVASASFNVNATANTVQYFGDGTISPGALRNRLGSLGDRLGLVVTGAAQSTANVCITVSLRPTA